MTQSVIPEILGRNPNTVLLIVSTYAPEAEKQAREPYGTFLSAGEKSYLSDKSSPHYGQVVYLFLNEPSHQEYPDFWRTNKMNQNLQRLSSYAGLQYAASLNIEYSLKLRSDAFLGKRDACSALTRYVQDYPIIASPDQQVNPLTQLKGRIATPDHTRTLNSCFPEWPMRQYFICDQWMFGYTTDLKNFFSLSSPSWDCGRGIKTDLLPENHLMECWMKDLGIPPTSRGIEEMAGRYMIIAGMVEFEYLSLKRQSYQDYLSRGVAYLTEVFTGWEKFCVFFKEAHWLKAMAEFQTMKKDHVSA